MSLQVIGAGFGRTGTLSMKAALEQLGYVKCHHMVEVLMAKDSKQLDHWDAVGQGQRPGWDEIFEGYQASVRDIFKPCAGAPEINTIPHEEHHPPHAHALASCGYGPAPASTRRALPTQTHDTTPHHTHVNTLATYTYQLSSLPTQTPHIPPHYTHANTLATHTYKLVSRPLLRALQRVP